MPENQTIGDIFANNDKIHEKTKLLAASLSDEQTKLLADDGKWTIAHIIEHVAIVQDGMTKISAKLLNEAKNADKKSNGEAVISENFLKKAAEIRNQKLQAPERVQPTGNLTIAESLLKMSETRKTLEDLRPLFESIECSEFKFPHPALGDLTAHEWLMLIGGHEARHLMQIKRILGKAESE